MQLQQIDNMETLEMIAATIAHEVKSPLSLVQANVDFLRLMDGDPENRKRYDIISRELRKANELVLDFLGLVKLAYKTDEEIEVYDVLMNTVESYEGAGNVSIYVECPNKNLYVKGNRMMLSWVVSNILKNSLEAVSENGIIKIFVYEGRDTVVVEFLDNGCGISPERLEQLNQGRVVSSKPHGSGVGISICKNILAEHGGAYDIRNINGGCLVRINLPIVQCTRTH
ncbi:MAG: HAMP domain-containing histidine kinase [Defluviitaleaceae bacterium]|nr:HAMP domain-containing histidine kinase [Defluviitaleaceae bacterium]